MRRLRSNVSPAFLMTVPEGLKMMSRSAKQGETTFHRTDRPRNSSLVGIQRTWQTALHSLHS